MKRSRREGCLSDLRIDLLVRGELDDGDGDGARAHVDGCDDCRGRVAAIEATRAAFVAGAPRLTLPSRPARLPRRSLGARLRPWLVAAALPAAAALVLMLRPHPTTRTKGGFGFGFYVKHGDDVRLADPNETVAPGDALRFFYTAPEPTWLAIVSVDPTGRASVYYPGGDRLAPAGVAHQQLLPESTALDDSVGTEQLYALFCDRDQPTAPLVRALAGGEPAPDGCRVERWTFHKRRP